MSLTAPPVDGAANALCRDFLADWLGVKRSQIELVGGEKSREKRFRLTGLTDAEIEAKIRDAWPEESQASSVFRPHACASTRA